MWAPSDDIICRGPFSFRVLIFANVGGRSKFDHIDYDTDAT